MKRFVLLLLPSSLGAVLILGISLLIVGFNAWSYIQYRQFFYDFLFGVGGLKTIMLQSPDHLTLIRRAIFGNGDGTYYVLLAMAGLLTGITTYVVINAITRAKDAAQDIMLEMNHTEVAFRRTVDEALTRLVIRTISVIGWTIYFIFWLNFLMPYTTLMLESAMDMIARHQILGYIIITIAYMLVALSLHLHVIFLRLCLLKVRVIGDVSVDD